MEHLALALQLLGIGMITVFIILILVTLVGRTIIYFVNIMWKDPVPETSSIDPSLVAVISAAVTATTLGQGHIQKIEKV